MPPLVLMKGIGPGRSSPGSRWRRFIIVTAVRKSDRSFIGAFLNDLFNEIYQFFLSLVLLRGWTVGMVFLCQSIHLDALLLGPANFEWRITKNWISLEAIVNSIKILFDATPPRVTGYEVLFLCLSSAVPSTVGSLLLDDEVRNWESIQSPMTKNLTGFAFNQEMSTGAIDHSSIPLGRHSEHCTFVDVTFLQIGLKCVWGWLSIFFTSSRTRKFSACFTTPHAIQTLWSQCLFPRVVWTNRWIVHFQRVFPFLFELRLRFRLRLCLDLNVQQTLAHYC